METHSLITTDERKVKYSRTIFTLIVEPQMELHNRIINKSCNVSSLTNYPCLDLERQQHRVHHDSFVHYRHHYETLFVRSFHHKGHTIDAIPKEKPSPKLAFAFQLPHRSFKPTIYANNAWKLLKQRGRHRDQRENASSQRPTRVHRERNLPRVTTQSISFKKPPEERLKKV